MGALTTILLIVAVVLAAVTAFQGSADAGGGVTGRLHLGWLALAFFAMAHLV